MESQGVQFSVFRGSQPRGALPPPPEIQELWFSLARRRWSSLVLVPADEGSSAAEVATGLADVGGRLRDSPVTAIVADRLDFESARRLSELQRTLKRKPALEDSPRVEEGSAPRTAPFQDDGATRSSGALNVIPIVAAGQVIVSIQPVVVEPLGVAVAHAADAVVLCVRMGVARLEAARRTLELIGPERVAGAFLVR